MSTIAGNTQNVFAEQVETIFNQVKRQAELYPYVREKSFQFFIEQGVPTVKNEEWRHTNTEPFLKCDYTIPSLITAPSEYSEIKNELNLKCHILFFVNGYYQKQHSSIIPDDDGIEISSIRESLLQDEVIWSSTDEILPNDGWKNLNDAFVLDGIRIRIKKNKTAQYPIRLIHLSNASEKPLLIQSRNIIILEPNAEATVIESFYATGNGATLTNNFEHIEMGNDARLTCVKLQQLENATESTSTDSLIHYTSCKLHQSSRMKCYTIALGGSLIRNNLYVVLQGSDGEAILKGLYTPTRNQIIDNRTHVDHAVSNCQSNELYKGIADDQAKAVFNGKILVRKDAQKTGAYQSNKNLLLSQEATIYTKPQLEIFADDVKCSHGATSGQLDDESLFYLQARGVCKDEARKMLIRAFAEDITTSITSEEIKTWLNNKIEQKLQ